MMAMMATANARIVNATLQEGLGHLADIARTSPVNLNPLVPEHIQRTIAHVAGQHNANPFLPQKRGNIAFTPAPLWRWE
jgi:hypothetical protein